MPMIEAPKPLAIAQMVLTFTSFSVHRPRHVHRIGHAAGRRPARSQREARRRPGQSAAPVDFGDFSSAGRRRDDHHDEATTPPIRQR